MPLYGKKHIKIFSKTKKTLWLNIDKIYNRGREFYKACLNEDHRLIFDLYK